MTDPQTPAEAPPGASTGAPPDAPTRAPLDDLMRVVVSAGMLPSTTARVLLGNISTDELYDHVRSGALSAVVVRGELHVDGDQTRALVLTLHEQRTSELVSLIEPMRALLTAYLERVEVTPDFQVAHDQGRPLLSARRGRPRVDLSDPDAGDLGGHAVLVSVRALSALAQAEPDIHAELPRLPVGPGLKWRLVALDGVEEQSHAVPASDPGSRSKRLRGWVRVDPARYRVRLSDAARAVMDR